MPLVNVMEHRAGERSGCLSGSVGNVAHAIPKKKGATCLW